jgi:predicted ArsR family transcriptional regulator
VKHTGWRKRLFESTRGQILQLLRSKNRTVNEFAAELQLTDNAVRAHLLSLERDGLVYQSGTQPGFRKPHATYALTADAEQIFPKAYGPLVDLILTVFSRKLTPGELRAGMREVGRKVAHEHLREVEGKPRQQRINAALRILSDLGGAASFEKSEGKQFIRGHGCPLAAATGRHPEACLIAESLLSQIIGVPVKEHCMRQPAPSCCFEIS